MNHIKSIQKDGQKIATSTPESLDEIGEINEALEQIEQKKQKLEKLAITVPRSVAAGNGSPQVAPDQPRQEESEQIGEITLSLNSKWVIGMVVFLLLLTPLSNLLLQTDPPSVIAVQALTVQRQDIHPQILSTGQVVAANMTQVTSQIAGQVTQVFRKEGDIVRKGDPLFRLQQLKIDNRLQTAQENFALAFTRWKESAVYYQTLQKKYSEKKQPENSHPAQKFWQLQQRLLASLAPKGSIDRQQIAIELKKYRLQGEELMGRYLQKKSAADVRSYLTELKYQAACQQWEIAVQALARARNNFLNLLVRAPVDGQIQQLHVTNGMEINPGMPTAILVDPGDKQINVTVREAYLPYLQNQAGKLEARIQIPSSSNRYFSGSLSGVSISRQGSGCQLTLKFSEKHPEIFFGLQAAVEIALPIKPGCLAVPHQAIVFKKNVGSTYPVVYTLRPEGKEYRIQIIPVKLGVADRQLIEIIEGLHGDELIVTGCRSGLENLYDNMIVSVD